MASSYTPLGVELQATGENAGTWGTKTNTNYQFFCFVNTEKTYKKTILGPFSSPNTTS